MRTTTAALAFVLVAAASAEAGDRYAIAPGDTARAESRRPGEIDEFLLPLARGAIVTLRYSPEAPGAWTTTADDSGLVTFDYVGLSVYVLGPTLYRTAEPLAASGTYRVLARGADGRIGGYRVRAAVKPGRRFRVTSATPAAPTVFGAFAGQTATLSLRWKGEAVTLLSVTGPDGRPVVAASQSATSSGSVHRGFTIAATGDHLVELQIPEGTTSWSLTSAVAGTLPRGTLRDFRTTSPPDPPGVRISQAPLGGGLPNVLLIDVLTETGGPDDLALSASQGQPFGVFLDARIQNSGIFPLEAAPATRYVVVGDAWYFAEIDQVLREDGRVASMRLPTVQSPSGTGETTIALEYDPGSELPVGWTETRVWHATGARHVLEVKDLTRSDSDLTRGLITSCTVTHTGPGGTREYQFSPLDP